jgi:hypothetical protein
MDNLLTDNKKLSQKVTLLEDKNSQINCEFDKKQEVFKKEKRSLFS